MKKIAKSNLSALFAKISETKDLYLPIKNGGQVNFAAYTEESEVDLTTLTSVAFDGEKGISLSKAADGRLELVIPAGEALLIEF